MSNHDELSNFHAGMFQYAMQGLIGREASSQYMMGLSGYYQWWWYPENDTEKKQFEQHAYTIAQWIDRFTGIVFSRTKIGYGPVPTMPEKTALYVFVGVKYQNKD